MNKQIDLDVESRQRDIQIEISRGSHGNLSFELSGGAGGRKPPYKGPYEVDAKLEEDQVLDTYGKVMTENLTFHGMPVKITTNPAGGLTYSIGG